MNGLFIFNILKKQREEKRNRKKEKKVQVGQMQVNVEAIKGTSMIFIGCCLNVIFFELIIK